MDAKTWLLECLKFIYGLLVAAIVFLFFCLLLDSFSWFVNGGWEPLLGSWPIYSGTVGEFFYGNFWTVIGLLISVGGIARIVMWRNTPSLLAFLTQPSGEESV